jgi:cell wall-associated NlpC family hydrolase
MSLADISVSARVADVHARIAALHTRFGATPTLGAGSAAGQFDAVLSQAVGTPSPATSASATAVRPSTGPGPGSTSASVGQRAVAIARQQLGKPYVWGAENPSVGFDCSGLVQHTFKQLGIDLPRVSRDQARAGRAVGSLADARPGDLIAFGSPVNHIGIYAGSNKMVVAPQTGDVVKVQEIYRTPTAIRRVI